MPRLHFINANSQVDPPRPPRWWTELTSRQDRQAAAELGLLDKTGIPLDDEQEVRSVHEAINTRSNQIRNPSLGYGARHHEPVS